MTARAIYFTCWWCRRQLGIKRRHHDVLAADTTTRRECCTICYANPASSYHKVYVDEDQERAEVRRLGTASLLESSSDESDD